MDYVYYAAAAVLVFGALAAVVLVGKPRKPIDGATAACVVVINAAYIYLLLRAVS